MRPRSRPEGALCYAFVRPGGAGFVVTTDRRRIVMDRHPLDRPTA